MLLVASPLLGVRLGLALFALSVEEPCGIGCMVELKRENSGQKVSAVGLADTWDICGTLV